MSERDPHTPWICANCGVVFGDEQGAAIVAELRALNAELAAALKNAVTAIDDWLNIYASDQCDAARVQEAKVRISEFGTLAYIACVQKKNRDALCKAGEQ